MRVSTLDQMRLSITAAPDSSAHYVRILGDVDLSDTRQLSLAAQRLIGTGAGPIYVDLGGTTFMGSTLAGFLAQIATNGRTRRDLVLCRPTAAALRVIQMTGLDQLVDLRSDLPAAWVAEADEQDCKPTAGHESERSFAS